MSRLPIRESLYSTPAHLAIGLQSVTEASQVLSRRQECAHPGAAFTLFSGSTSILVSYCCLVPTLTSPSIAYSYVSSFIFPLSALSIACRLSVSSHGICSNNRPKPVTGCLICSRFWIDHTRAGTGCTTGT